MRRRPPRPLLPLAAALLLVLLGARGVADPEAAGAGADGSGVAPEGLLLLRGDLHAHTCYSDGEGAPADAYAAAKAAGFYDFFAVTEHSEAFEVPFCADEACLPDVLGCYASPLPSATEWQDVLAQAEAATDARFVGIRGFEWSHPLEGHVNVWGSDTYVGSQTVPSVAGLYAWLALPGPPGGGAGAAASFNHPGREPLMFHDFAYLEAADAQVHALEVYNRGDVYLDEYLQALDAGWHVGAIGVSDGHSPDRWVRVRGHTLVLAEERTREAVLDAMRAGRTAGTDDPAVEVVFEAAGTLMGGRVDAPEEFPARVHVRDPGSGHGVARIEVLRSGGAVVAGLDPGGAAEVVWAPVLRHADAGEETWFAVRVEDVGGRTAVTAPVWVR